MDDAELLADGEVPVVSRHRAQEAHRARPLAPGIGGAAKPEHVGRQHEEIHEGEAAVAAHQGLGLGDPQPLRRQGPGLGDPVQAPIAAGVGAVRGAVVPAQDPVQPGRELELRDARLAAGEVQVEPIARQMAELLLELQRPRQ